MTERDFRVKKGLKVEGGDVVVSSGHKVDTPTLDVTTINLGNSDTTLVRSAAGDASIEGNVIYRAGGTTIPISDGGTGATSDSAARTALGLAIGTNVQAFDAQLTDVAGLTPSDSGVIIGDGSNFVVESGTTLRTSLGLGTASTPNFNSIELGDGQTDTTIARGSAGVVTIEGAEVRTGTVAIANGGTGATSVGAARTALGVDVAGTDNSTPMTLATVSNNYLSVSGTDNQTITAGTVPISLGGTGATSDSAARTALGVDPAGTDNSTPMTLAAVSSNYLSVSGTDNQTITAGVVPIALGGTGATSDSAARTALGVDAAGTDNSTNVTMTGTPNYITINGNGQVITRNQIDLAADVTGSLPDGNVANDLTISGGTVNNSVIGGSTPAAGTFTTIATTTTSGTSLTSTGHISAQRNISVHNIQSGGTTGGGIKFFEAGASPQGNVQIRGPDTISTSDTYVLELPGEIGSAGQVLSLQSVSSSVGVLQFSTVSTGSPNADDIGTGDAQVDIETSTGGIVIGATNNQNVSMGSAGSDITITADDFDLNADNNVTIDTTDTTDGIKIGTSTSGVPITLGHSTSEVTVADNLTITGNLTVNGDTTTVSTSNSVVEDSLIELNTGATSNSKDLGFIFERGSTGNNAAIIWDESEDKFTMGTTTGIGTASTVSVTAGTLVTNIEGNLTGTIQTAAQTNITSVGALGGGSITSGFGAINIGSSFLTAGRLNIDNIRIDGSTISSTNSNGDITLTPNGAGEVNIAAGNLNYAGTAVTATGVELNLLDGLDGNLGTVVNSKVATYSSAGKLAATTVDFNSAIVTDAFKQNSNQNWAASAQDLDSFSATAHRGAKVLIQMHDASNTHYEIVEMNVTHDGSTAYYSVYGQVSTHTADLGTYSATLASNTIKIQFTPATGSLNWKYSVKMDYFDVQ
jgi:hypothetical protein